MFRSVIIAAIALTGSYNNNNNNNNKSITNNFSQLLHSLLQEECPDHHLSRWDMKTSWASFLQLDSSIL